MTDTTRNTADAPSLAFLAGLAVLVALFLFTSAWALRTIVLGDSANSRLATAYALVHHGHWWIDDRGEDHPNPFEAGTVDKVELDGRILSTKPPVLPLLMTAEYAAFHHGLGWTLMEDRDQTRWMIRFMVFTLSVLPMAAALVFFALALRMLGATEAVSLFLTAALAFGSQVMGFAPGINNHVPCVAVLCVMGYIVVGLVTRKLPPRPVYFYAYGLCGALVFTLDMPATIYAAAAGLALLAKFPRQASMFGGAGLALPLLAHFAAMLDSSGSILPIQTRESLYLYEAAYWRNPGGIDALNEPKLIYLFHMTFGRFGTFLLFPVLALGLAGFVKETLRPGNLRPWVLGAFACFVVVTAYYMLKTNNYGGAAYGFRWHMASVPALLLMAVPVMPPAAPRWVWGIAVALLAVSGFSAWQCYQAPWGTGGEWTVHHLFGPAVVTDAADAG
ncbi:MAG: hypothetical protein GC168_04465 [Candidatus Hydrogenedens sp.]|nr:hypothetical protein [Candidatus Hydrogenedens sp.]